MVSGCEELTLVTDEEGDVSVIEEEIPVEFAMEEVAESLMELFEEAELRLQDVKRKAPAMTSPFERLRFMMNTLLLRRKHPTKRLRPFTRHVNNYLERSTLFLFIKKADFTKFHDALS